MPSTAVEQTDAKPYQQRILDSRLDDLLDQLSGLMIIGPRACGKTTTAERRAATTIRLDRPASAAAFEADADAALRELDEPVLLDEWQEVPGVFGAARREIDRNPEPGRFLLTGSILAENEFGVHPGTGRIQRISMYPMTIREQRGNISGSTFFDRMSGNEGLATAPDPPDLRGYVDLALRSGFPIPALNLDDLAREAWLESYLRDLLTHDVAQLDGSPTRKTDTQRLTGYFEAFALNSAGVTEHKHIFDTAGVTRDTGLAYERLLTDLMLIEQIPAWSTNRLKRLVKQPKRYVVEPALIAAQLRMNTSGVMADGNVLGRLIDTLVMAQLRPELSVSRSRPKLYHLRTQSGRHEIGLVAELAGGRVIAIEVKSGPAPKRSDARHIEWLRDEIGDRFLAGLVFHTGPGAYNLAEGIKAVPIAALWG